MDSTSVAYDIYDVYENLGGSDHKEHVLLQYPGVLDEWGDTEVFDVSGFMSKVLEFFVDRLSEVLGEAVFYGGLSNRKSPKWFKYELMAVWDHGGVKKYITWRTIDRRAVIVAGLWTKG